MRPTQLQANFAGFDQAGYAKMAANFRLAPTAGRRAPRLSTETQVACTDAASARRFARYWWLIRPASGAIRRSWLAAIKRRAERHPDGDANPQLVLAVGAVAPAGGSHRLAGIPGQGLVDDPRLWLRLRV